MRTVYIIQNTASPKANGKFLAHSFLVTVLDAGTIRKGCIFGDGFVHSQVIFQVKSTIAGVGLHFSVIQNISLKMSLINVERIKKYPSQTL